MILYNIAEKDGISYGIWNIEYVIVWDLYEYV